MIFSPTAKENIAKTGNVWGATTEYWFNFKVRIWRRVVKLECRKGSTFMGRFGGGWGVKIGLQAGSFTSLFLLQDVILNLFTFMVRISKVES